MKRNLPILIGLAVLLYIVFSAASGVSAMRGSHGAEQLAAQRRAVERAAVLCYALEGAYPPDIEYLSENYGLIIDRDSYIIHYQTYGANIRPEVKVFARSGGGGL